MTKSSFRRPNGNASINASDELESNTEFEELETIAEKTATSVVDSDEELDSDDDSDSLPMKGEDYYVCEEFGSDDVREVHSGVCRRRRVL